MIRIITDSTCDISKSAGMDLEIDIVPVTVSFGNEEFLDGMNISHEEFYEKLSRCDELPKTSQPSPAVFSELFMKYAKEGDEIIGIFISSDLSGTFQSASIAACDVEETLGVSGKIHIIDSKNVSMGTAILIREAVKMRNAGYSATDIVSKCNELVNHIKVYAIVGSLKYLKMGGRLTSAEAMIGSLLHITPIVTVEDGKVAVYGKARGKKSAENLMHSILKENEICLSRDFIFAHIECADSLSPFVTKSLSALSDFSADVGIVSIGAAVGTHVGPGTYGFAFVENYEGAQANIRTA